MNKKQALRAAFTAAFLLTSIQNIQANWFTSWFSSSTKTRDTITQETVNVLKSANVTPQNTAFVFDMHGVVVKCYWWKPSFCWNYMLKPFWSVPNKLHMTSKVVKYFCKNKNPKRSIEGLVLETKNADPYAAAAIKLINPHIPIDGTVEIIEHLKVDDDKEFQIFGCSNIGEKSYELMKRLHPAVFSNFTDCHTTKRTGNNYEKKKKTTAAYTETINMIKSSMDDDAFAQVEHIIFVDNKMSNLERAKEADARFKGIFFTSPEQFQRDLEEIGLDFNI